MKTAFFLYVFFSHFLAQNPLSFKTFTSNEGLAHNSVLTMIADSNGFKWFGTLNGFSRFDGHNFLNFLSNDSGFEPLHSQLTILHFMDAKKRLWLNGRNKGNLLLFDTKSFKFDTIPELKTHSKATQLSANKILILNNKELWTLDSNLTVLSKRSLHPYTTKIHKTEQVKLLHYDQFETLYFLHRARIYTVNTNNEWGYEINIRKYIKTDSKIDIIKTYVDSEKRLWLGSYAYGLLIFSPNGTMLHHFTKKELASNAIYAIKEHQNRFYIGTRNGFVILENDTVVERYTHKAKEIASLSSNSVSDFLIDSEKKLWVATYGGGVNVATLKKPLFNLVRKNKNTKLTSNFISSILKTDNELWVSSIDGLNRLTLGSNNWEQFHHENANSSSISSNVLFNLAETKNGDIWLATDGAGLNRYRNGRFQHYKVKDGLNSMHTMRLRVIKDKLWIGHKTAGINIYSDGRFASLKHNPKKAESISGNSIRDIFEDRNGNIWVSTVFSGINKIDPKTLRSTRYLHPFKSVGKNYSAVWAIADDAENRIWFGSSKDGLFSYSLGTGDVENFTVSDGLANNTIYAIENDRDRFLWISTNNGLSQLDLKNLTFRNFTEKDNLQNNEFNQFSSFKDKNGMLYFGGLNGFNYFDPKKVTDEKENVKMVLTAFKLLNSNVFHPVQLAHVSEHTINFDQKFISFDFSAVSTADLTYKFRLLGQSEDWIYAAKHTGASFTNLREGSYIFEATIHEENAAFVAAPLRFKLTVLPPWFRTTWAYFLFAFIALLLFYLGRWLAKNWRFLISPRTKFIGKFKLIKILGTGNMSKVYEAYDPDRKKAVAIKLVENDENTADDIFRMFIKEAEIGKELEHENIVRIFDAGTANNARYLTMEKIEGITLKTAINENLIKTDTERFAIAAKLLRALAYLHEKGIVHRDLKSSNVMVNLKTGDLKLMDFGLSSARQLVSLADRSAIVGTLGYMSPEQTIGKGVSQQSDIYSFGVILYELFFNELPFLAANEMELIFAIHNETPTQFILSKKPIINLIKTCMARDVAARFANANKILRLLEDLKNEIAITI